MGQRAWIRWFVGACGLAAVLWGALPAGAQEDPTQTTQTTQPGQPGEPAPGTGEAVQGRIAYREDDEQVPVEDMDVTVASQDGAFEEETTTDEDGEFRVDVPGPGTYVVTIDADDLPEGVTLRDEDGSSRNIALSPGDVRTVLFRLSTGEEVGGASELTRALRLSVQGVRFGLTIAMCAIGLSLIFGTTGLVNFAHGEMVTFGALMAYFFNVTVGMSLLIAGPLAIVCGGLLGAGFDRLLLWRPLRKRGTGLVALLVISIGLGILLRYVFVYQFGASRRSYVDFNRQLDPVEIGPVDVVPRDLWTIALSATLLVAVGLVLQRTRIGKAVRAVADDRDLAEASGINVDSVVGWVWIAGGALAAVGGIFLALDEQIRWDMGAQLLLLMFAGVILGGLGTAYGALVGSLVVGLFVQLSTLVIDTEFKTAGALAVMIVVLVIRPQGILGQAERVG